MNQTVKTVSEKDFCPVNFKSNDNKPVQTKTKPMENDTFEKMAEEQHKAIKKNEKTRKFSIANSLLITGAFLATVGITAWQAFHGKLNKPKIEWQKLGDNIPNANDACVNPQVKNIINKMKALKTKSSELLNWAGKNKKSAQMITLYGPPGTGKTLSAKIIAKELGAEYTEVQFSQLSSIYVGETAVKITKMFESFKKEALKNPNKNYVVNFNEIDSLINNVEMLGGNNAHLGQNRTAFLNGLDLVKDVPNLIITGTTNINPKSAKLDSATLSRFGQVIEIGLPSKEELIACLKYQLKDIEAAQDLLKNKKELEKIAKMIFDKKGSQRDVNKIVEGATDNFLENLTDKSQKFTADYLEKEINNKKFWASSIHGDVLRKAG